MITTENNGAYVTGAPLTTTVTNEAAPGLLRNAIDDRIVKIRPMATPIDQLSRCAGARHCNAMKVEYYSVDAKPVCARVTKEFQASDATITDVITLTVATNRNAIFAPSETLLVPSVKSTVSGDAMVLYVIECDEDKGIKARWVNGELDENGNPAFGSIPTGTEIVRMGRAAAELDVQTAQFEALPVKRSNYCQIFKMQVEQSTFQRLANKEVGWNFSDQEEVAIIDMRLGMEKNFLFGVRAAVDDPGKRESVYLTGGIWRQTSKTFEYDPATLTESSLIDLCRKAFTGNSGSNRKILIGGSGLIDALSKLKYDRSIEAGKTLTKWGIEFKEIRSNFGSLYVLCSEIFDQCGHAGDGFVLDPDYLTKYCHVPFHTETLDLRRAGTRNTDAIVITEASCLVLRHPDAHMRIVAKA